MDPGDRSSNGDSGGVDCVFGPEQRCFSGHPRGPRRNPSDDRPWRLVVGCLALWQKAYRPSGTLELCLKRRNPNSVHPVRLLYPYFGFRETAIGEHNELEREGKMERTALIGSSPSFRALLEDVQVVAPADCAVLIQGETGTGKEVIAQAIHEASPRRQHRFVALNCAAIPAALLESELFGHERGAFTGAVAQRLGRFQAADRGTLFLDEIGELPIELQPKLLRVLQEREVERLGCSHATRVDVRIVAATNQNLEQMVRERRFRMDLYYRLKVFPITLPPLRERIGDIPRLVDHFLRSYAHRQGKSIEFVPDEVMAAIERYSWPGNIRELQNFIERSVILTKGPALQAPIEVLERNDLFAHEVCTLADADRVHILGALRETHWVVGGKSGAASRLGLNRTTLIAKMQKLGISRETAEQRARLSNSHANAPLKALSVFA
jgi:formate hydrogenlyase transcriptional activator